MTATNGAGKPEQIRIADRKKEALRLRRLGLGYFDIGQQLGISTSQAHSDVQSELRLIPADERADLIALTNQQIDMAISAMMPKVAQGSVTAVQRVTSLLERRCRLFGLDAPTQVHIENGVDLDALRQQIQDLTVPDADPATS